MFYFLKSFDIDTSKVHITVKVTEHCRYNAITQTQSAAFVSKIFFFTILHVYFGPCRRVVGLSFAFCGNPWHSPCILMYKITVPSLASFTLPVPVCTVMDELAGGETMAPNADPSLSRVHYSLVVAGGGGGQSGAVICWMYWRRRNSYELMKLRCLFLRQHSEEAGITFCIFSSFFPFLLLFISPFFLYLTISSLFSFYLSFHSLLLFFTSSPPSPLPDHHHHHLS